jgi:hypothetical protein
VHRIFSLWGLTIVVWVSSVAFEGILAGLAVLHIWHPHFAPVLPMLALVMFTGLSLIVGSGWRIVWGPSRPRALSCLLIGVAPLWLLAGQFLCGFAAWSKKSQIPNFVLRPLVPLGDAVRDVDARFRYPMRTLGEKVEMISPPMPATQARDQVAAMDRHIRSLEARLGRSTEWTVRWARGPVLGEQGKAPGGLSIGSRPGEWWADAEGLTPTDRHEVAHGMIASFCRRVSDPPSVLIEGWASANMGSDPIEKARILKHGWERGHGFTLRQLTGEEWYGQHESPAYLYGGPLVDFLLCRFGPEKFLELYTTCGRTTFDADCRRILSVDIDALDAALRAEIDRSLGEAGSLDRHRLEHLKLDPRVAAERWKAFLVDYFAAAERLHAPNRQVRLSVVTTRSDTDAQGQTEKSSFEERSLRSGDFASLRYKTPYYELARLSHPQRSLVARRSAEDRTWQVDDESKRTPEQSRRRCLDLIEMLDAAGYQEVAPLMSLSQNLLVHINGDYVVAALEHFTEGDRPRVRVRFEDRSPAETKVQWRATTLIFAVDDFYAAQAERLEGDGPDGGAYESNFNYDRHEGIPVLLSMHTTKTAPDGSHGTIDLEVVERRFGPIPEDEFNPDRFLDGPQVTKTQVDPHTDKPSAPGNWIWTPFVIGTLCLVVGSVIPIRPRQNFIDPDQKT